MLTEFMHKDRVNTYKERYVETVSKLSCRKRVSEIVLRKEKQVLLDFSLSIRKTNTILCELKEMELGGE